MSTSTALGIVGGAVGFWIGGPTGAQIGFALGSAVGGYVDPEQVFGPRLQDASVQTSRVGIPIPFGWGTFPVAGNLLWAGPITEHENSERQGKGGGPEQITYTYTRSYAIGLCQGMLREDGLFDPIAGVVMVKRNGKVVYDARTDAELQEEWQARIDLAAGSGSVIGTLVAYVNQLRAISSRFMNHATVYLGSEDQLPDPTMEMHVGAGNVPAYPGLAYMLVDEDDVTETAGAIPQFEVVVATGGTVASECNPHAGLRAWWPLSGASDGGTAEELVGGKDATFYGAGIDGGMTCDAPGEGAARYGSFGEFNVTAPFSVSVTCTPDAEMADNAVICASFWNDFDGRYGWGISLADMQVMAGQNNGTFTGVSGPILSVGVRSKLTLTCGPTGIWKLYVDGVLSGINDVDLGVSGTGTYTQFGGNPAGTGFFNGTISDVRLYNVELTQEEVLIEDEIGFVAIPDAPGFYVRPDGTIVGGCSETIDRDSVVLGNIVAGLLRRVGIPSTSYDVSQLTDLVEGVKFANVSGPDLMIAPLMQAYRFDKDERDGKLYFVKRGGDVAASIGPDDLVERDGDAIEWTRVQEAELLRKTSVTYIDPAANWALNTQDAERRTSTVLAKGESAFEVPVCASHDAAKQMADIALKIAWSEPDSCKFSLSLAWSELSCTDVVALTDKAGVAHRVRIEQIEEDSGVLLVEARKDRQSTYTSNVQGTRPKPPNVTTPGLIGPTQLVVMDLPVMRDADDRLGVLVAVRGYLSGWQGAALYLSTDGGVSGGIVANITQASVIGYTETALVPDVSSEYPSGQTLQVWLPSAPASVDYATLLRYNNRAALQLDSGEWEVVQYQTVTDDGDGLYTLSGLVRGRYATTPGEAAAGTTFVLLDSTAQFVECERWMVGASDMKVKAVSFGTNADSYAWQDFTFTTPASQTEWPPTNVAAERDGSDNLTATWVGRGRLGTETAPYHSQFFTGYRVSYSDGVDTFTYDVVPTTLVTSNGSVLTLENATHEYTAAMQTSDFGSVPASLTVSVAALNTITGAGPSSEEVTA